MQRREVEQPAANLYRIKGHVGGMFDGRNGGYFLEEQGSGRRGFITLDKLLMSTRAILANSRICTDIVLKGRPFIEQEDGSVTVEEIAWKKGDSGGFDAGEILLAHLVGLDLETEGPAGGLFRGRTHPHLFCLPLASRFDDDFLGHLGWDKDNHVHFEKEDIFHAFGQATQVQVLDTSFVARLREAPYSSLFP
jgi:hypothetical protein